ncbi:MFS transporter [Variovorax sp. YR752]|uniref:MFS transporter n=1 Tax=Variovorax sp. YR752 TaxID=1884383 RepID=UPI0031377D9D
MPAPTTREERRRALLVPIVVGGILMGLALGVRHVQGLFMLPMTMGRGWPRETFALALALQNLVWGLAQPFTGMLADRWGSAKIVAAGALLYGLGLLLMSTATTPAALFVGGGLVIGLALSCTAFGVVYGALSRMSTQADRGWSLGLAGAIGGLGQFIAVPGTQALQDALGWERALVTLGALIALLVLFASKLDDSVRPGAGPGGDAARPLPMSAAISEAVAHRGFWLLNLGFLACGFQLAFIAAHLPAYLLDKGVHPNVAVTGLAVIALANVVGTFVCGQLGGAYRRKHLLCALYLVRSAAMALFVLLPLSPITVYLFCAVMGFLWLGTVPLTNGLVSQVFGVQYIGTLFGFVFFGHQLGAFLGVWLGGHVFDATRSYDWLWFGSIALGGVAAALHWPIDDRRVGAGLQASPA